MAGRNGREKWQEEKWQGEMAGGNGREKWQGETARRKMTLASLNVSSFDAHRCSYYTIRICYGLYNHNQVDFSLPIRCEISPCYLTGNRRGEIHLVVVVEFKVYMSIHVIQSLMHGGRSGKRGLGMK